MNEHILDYLNYYIDLPKPKYAVLLNGVWGCGKTFFIQKLIDEWREDIPFDNEGIVLRPIYISLYGISRIETVNAKIRKELSPFFYSKGMEYAKKIGIGLLKLTTKIDLDLDNNGTKDVELAIDMNPINLLRNESDEIKGKKILIFDDLERCKIPTDELLGYINNFVEHNSCKVILIGDEVRIKELYDAKDKGTVHYDEFKEKLIGQTFLIEKDVNSALTQFIEEYDGKIKDFYHTNFELILKCFNHTETNNLRLLRLSLLEFSRFTELIDTAIKERDNYEGFLKQVLVYFLICNCEYKSGNREIEKFQISYSDEAKEISGKYEALLIEKGIRHSSYTFSISLILDFVKNGFLESNKLNSYIYRNEFFRSLTIRDWEKLWNYYILDNDEFENLLSSVKKEFYSSIISNISELLHIAGLLLSIENNKLDKLNRQFIVKKAIGIVNKIFKDNEGLTNYNTEVVGIAYGKEYSSHNTAEFKSIYEYAYDMKQTQNSKVSGKVMKNYFENITDSTLLNVYDVLNKSVPNHSSPYSMTSIFKGISISKFTKQLLNLSNKSKTDLRYFLAGRYYLEGCGMRGEIYQYHIGDLEFITEIQDTLEKSLPKIKLIDKVAINKLLAILKQIAEKLDKLKDTAPSI